MRSVIQVRGSRVAASASQTAAAAAAASVSDSTLSCFYGVGVCGLLCTVALRLAAAAFSKQMQLKALLQITTLVPVGMRFSTLLRPSNSWRLLVVFALVLVHQPPFVLAVSGLDRGHGYPPLSPRSDEANAAAYMRKYQHYGRRATQQDIPMADYGLRPPLGVDRAAPPPQSLDIHVVAHTHDDVGWLSTPFA
jgi:hypothetical protein